MKAYLVFGVLAGVVIMIILIKGIYDERRERKEFVAKLYREYGKVRERTYGPEQYASIARFYEKHPSEGQIDDITWNDLNFDDIFKRINDTYSSAGEEYLYYLLRTPSYEEGRLEHLDRISEFFRQDADTRVRVQYILAKLGRTGKFSLHDYLGHLEVLGERSNLKHYIVDLLYLPAIGWIGIDPSMGLLFFAALSIYNIITYFKEKNEIDSYITSFSYVMRLLQCADKLGVMKIEVCSQELERINQHRRQLGRFRRGSFWLMSSGRMSGSGNPIDIVLDYLRMMLHLDLIKFNCMLAQIRKHTEDIDVLVQTVGYLESAITVGAFRESLKGQWCRPGFGERGTLRALELYHPMIAEPVKNSIVTEKGVLVTGSNASGKSTFLKTVAVGAILAQTIYTCPADCYEGEFYHICSSMALRDDLAGGESYYMVEVKALKRILDIAASSPQKVLCFVDEVLRGTNTVERIAASTQILQSLTGDKVLCFAATHDIELTTLLEGSYDNYHFEEEVEDGDIHFNYKLRSGRATTRNAIKLLSIMGYDQAIVERAGRQAEFFLQTGVWKSQEESI